MTATMPTTTANAQQVEAMTIAADPLLFIAGSGSGKIFTLVDRIVFLLTENAVRSEQIIAVTCTDEAPQKLTTRISRHMSAVVKLQHLGCIEAYQIGHPNRYEDVFNGR